MTNLFHEIEYKTFQNLIYCKIRLKYKNICNIFMYAVTDYPIANLGHLGHFAWLDRVIHLAWPVQDYI